MSDTLTTAPPVPTGTRPPLWTAIPGWGIAADLTPPELRKARQIAVLRSWIAAGLAVLVLICGGGFFLAVRQDDTVAADLTAASNRTLELQAIARSYSDVVSMQNRISEIDSLVAGVMAGDVDLVALTDVLQASLPTTMTIGRQDITFTTAAAADAASAATDGAIRIGTVSIDGTGTTLDDLADFVDQLEAVPGIVDVVPLTNSLVLDGTGTQYSLSLAVTDELLSHRFDVEGN